VATFFSGPSEFSVASASAITSSVSEASEKLPPPSDGIDSGDCCEQPNAAIAGISNVKTTLALFFIISVFASELNLHPYLDHGLIHRDNHNQTQPE
jgi:hypothetical protein